MIRDSICSGYQSHERLSGTKNPLNRTSESLERFSKVAPFNHDLIIKLKSFFLPFTILQLTLRAFGRIAWGNSFVFMHTLVLCTSFLPRDAMQARPQPCMRCLSFGLSVCLSCSYILSKRINISLKYFHHRVATPFYFFHTKRYGNIPTAIPLTGASNAGVQAGQA